ncbi:MAG TPA: spore coat U domain-containing protein [Anaeromyxobacter sp.]|nr:spore coat U domain-containing protein [Anaeromyxobacter sp.]
MKRLLTLSIVALALVFVSAPAPAPAATATATLTVQATVVASCTIAAQTLNFGNYDGMQNDTPADVTVTCNTPVLHWIGIDSGGSGVRQMTNGANVLNYELYRDLARTVVWTNLDPGAGLYKPGTQGSIQTVYGRIPAGQTPPMGAYSQNVTMTVNF